MKYSLSLLFMAGILWLLTACKSEPKKLTPRMMKEVDKEFRKTKKSLMEEMDSLCILYKEKELEDAVDSLVELRLLQDKEKRIYIED